MAFVLYSAAARRSACARLTISASTTETPWPLRVHDDGIEVDFGDVVGMVGGEVRQPHHQFGERVGVGRRRAAMRPEQRRALEAAEQAQRGLVIERHRRQRDVAERFDRTPPSPTISSGPQRASRLMPRITSRPAPAIGCTSTPSMRAFGA